MTTAITTIATRNDLKVCDRARLSNIPPGALLTIQDLLTALQFDSQIPMLRTTATHVSACMGRPVDQVAIDVLIEVGPQFTSYLRATGRYKPKAISSYRNFANILLRKAKELGWEPPISAIADEWQAVWEAVVSFAGVSGILRYAVRNKISPSQFCDRDLDMWEGEMLKAGRTYRYPKAVKSRFRRALLQAHLTQRIPNVTCRTIRDVRYGVPLPLFPATLRNEVQALLDWKQAEYEEDRPKKAKHRQISAKHLENVISRFYGFVTKIKPGLPGFAEPSVTNSFDTLVALVTKESVGAFIKWCLNVRRMQKYCVGTDLGMLYAALKQHPRYKSHDLAWLGNLLANLPTDPQSIRRARKARKYLPYRVVAAIPSNIRAIRDKLPKNDLAGKAILVRDELLMFWLVTLAWRQRNIRECRIGPHANGANLFKEELSPLSNCIRPAWVEERLRVNPRECFWAFHFQEHETKTKSEIEATLPLRLVPLLEEYMSQWRPILLNRRPDPGTLFLNEDGESLTRNSMTELVAKVTRKYGGKRVTPHIFRDIFAYRWLDDHPRDYLTLSKLLWHQNINTTIRIYGSQFDYSHALTRAEEWFDKH